MMAGLIGRRLAGIGITLAVVVGLSGLFVLRDDAPRERPQTHEPEQSLALFVHDKLGSPYLGACPQEQEGEPIPAGVCSLEVGRSHSRATYLVGEPFSEWFGKAILKLQDDGSWSVRLLKPPSIV